MALIRKLAAAALSAAGIALLIAGVASVSGPAAEILGGVVLVGLGLLSIDVGGQR